MQEEVKNPLEYGYLGDERVELTAKEFMQLKNAVEQGINATLESFLPEVLRYVDRESSEIVLEPNQEDLTSGKVVTVTDREATFNPANVKYQYNTKLSPDMIKGQQLIMEIHERNVETGVAKSIVELEALTKANNTEQLGEE
jgi:hypothetical protein